MASKVSGDTLRDAIAQVLEVGFGSIVDPRKIFNFVHRYLIKSHIRSPFLISVYVRALI
jgi:hypothetical protein